MSGLAAPSDRSFLEVWLISIGHGLTHWYPATFYLLLPLIGSELGLSYSEIGSILTCQFVAGAIANLPGGIIVDVVGRKGLLMALSLLWVGVPYLLMGFSHAYWMLLVCSMLVGIGNNTWHPTAIPLLGHRFPERRGLVVSIHSMGGNAGDALAPLAVGALLASFDWRSIVVANVIPGVAMAALILLYLGRQDFYRQDSDDSNGMRGGILAALKELLNNRTVVMLSLSGAFRLMTQNTLLTFLPLFLAQKMGYSPLWVGGVMFSLQAAGFAAAPVAGHFSDRMGRRAIIQSAMGMSAAVLLGMAVVGTSPIFVFFVAFLGVFLFAIRAIKQAWLLEATPKHLGGTAIGILFGTQAVGSSIGPAVGGVLADHFGLMSTFYFLAATIVIANVFILFTPFQSRDGSANDIVAPRAVPAPSRPVSPEPDLAPPKPE
jgi:MFS family permease